jgi:hypothetical protein
LADRNNLDLLLLQNVLGNVQWMADRVWSNYRLVHGNFTVNDANNVGSGTRRSIEMATQMPNAHGRQMGGNTTFYGGIGPRAPTFGVTDDSILLVARSLTGRNVFG